MFKFFRRVRQALLSESKFSKYLVYALGEILLVVVGILIALQINNWNEERKDRKIEQSYIELLSRDLSADSVSLNELISFSDHSVKSKAIILTYLKNETSKPDSLGTHFLRTAFQGVQSFVPNMGAFEELQSAGGLSLINDENIRNQILSLYNAYDEMTQNTAQFYLQNRWETRDLVYEKANGNLFQSSEILHENILEELLKDGELKGRIINNWAVTYNNDLKSLALLNRKTLNACINYLKTFK
ncbi:MAG: DUF6090 family protein [Balneola sp.]